MNKTAKELRERGLNVAIDISERKVGAQIEAAAKQKIPFVICLGPDEMKLGTFKVKELESGKETTLSLLEVPHFILERRLEK